MGVAGLDTLIGARYLSVVPGKGAQQKHFQGLDKAPVMADLSPGGLEVILHADRQGSLNPGAPIRYRQVIVGRVLSVALAADSSAVMVRAYIEPNFRNLIRENTRFWNTSGLRAELGVTGASLEVDSLSSLIMGGISLATPTQAGEQVATGHQFSLSATGDEDWLEWQPSLLVGDPLPDHLYPLPIPHRGELRWTHNGWISNSERSRHAWLLVTTAGLMGPQEILSKPEDTDLASVSLSVRGESFGLKTEPVASARGIALLPLAPAGVPWPMERIRAPEIPEDLLLIADTNQGPQLISSNRLTVDEGRWILESSLKKDRDWHGAVALSAKDGTVIGFLDARTSSQAVIPVTAEILSAQ